MKHLLHLKCDFIFLIQEIQKNYTALHYRINNGFPPPYSVPSKFKENQAYYKRRTIYWGGDNERCYNPLKDHSATSKKEVAQAFYLNVLCFSEWQWDLIKMLCCFQSPGHCHEGCVIRSLLTTLGKSIWNAE